MGKMKENTSGEDEGEYKIVTIVDSKKLIFTPERRCWAKYDLGRTYQRNLEFRRLCPFRAASRKPHHEEIVTGISMSSPHLLVKTVPCYDLRQSLHIGEGSN